MKLELLLLLLTALACTSFADILDRIAVVVERQVITEYQIDEELRVTAFLNQETLETDISARRGAAERLIAQKLIGREMEISNYLKPTSSDVIAYLTRVRDALGPDRFQSDLRSYGLSEEALREHLALQLTTLKFVDYRFRPESRTLVTPGRTLEQQADDALTAWLEQRRRQIKIEYFDVALK